MTIAITLPTWIRRAVHVETAAAPRALELAAGQRAELALRRGDGFRVASGEVVVLRPARWLGDVLVAPRAQRLREGELWSSVERERLTLLASASSRVLRLDR